jgi:hypothetical protein
MEGSTAFMHTIRHRQGIQILNFREPLVIYSRLSIDPMGNDEPCAGVAVWKGM